MSFIPDFKRDFKSKCMGKRGNPSAWVRGEIDFIAHIGKSGKSSCNRHGHFSLLTS